MNTRNLLSLLAVGGVVASLALACSSTEEDKFASSDSFCSSKAETLCANLATSHCGASVDACKTKQASLCNAAASAAQSQGRSYKSGAVQDCLDKLNEVYGDSGTHITPTGETEATDVCDRVFRGSKPAMTPCANTFECDGSLICDGVCATKEVVGLMVGCGNAGQVCDDATYCTPLGGKNFCVAKKVDGDICDPVMSPCISADRCVNHCVPRVTVGQACDNDAQCANEAPYCDLTSMPHQCRPKYESRNPACKDFGAL